MTTLTDEEKDDARALLLTFEEALVALYGTSKVFHGETALDGATTSDEEIKISWRLNRGVLEMRAHNSKGNLVWASGVWLSIANVLCLSRCAVDIVRTMEAHDVTASAAMEKAEMTLNAALKMLGKS